MNHPILDAIAGEDDQQSQDRAAQQRAQRQAAFQTYHAILGDAKRTTPKDRQALRDAMKVLGKSIQDVEEDAALIADARDHFHAACDIGDAEAAQEQASNALEHYIAVEMPKIEKQMAEEKLRLETVAHEATHRTGAARHSRSALDKLFAEKPWLVQFIPGLESGKRPANLLSYITDFCAENRKSPA